MKLIRHRHHPFGLNTTSTADISFMLLVFFLVTSSMYVDKGILRQMPPKDRQETPVQEMHVERENIMAITLDAGGEIRVNDTIVPISALRGQMQNFILSRGNKHLFTIEADPYCPYEYYFDVQNNLSEAYHDARQKFALSTYSRPIDRLTNEERLTLLTTLPHRVAENYHKEEPQ